MQISNVLSSIYDIVVTITMLYSLYLLFWKKYTKRQKHFYLYVTIVFLIDVIGVSVARKYFGIDQFYLYFPYTIFTIFYFGYFYLNDYKDKFNKVLLFLLTFLSLVFLIFFQVEEGSLAISTGVLLILILYQLAITLQWFWYIVNHVDEQNIVHKQTFWVSCALLIWSTFALFRMYPMYDLDKIDAHFLDIIINVFQVINIATYLLFLRGLRCTEYNILRTFNHF
jgi:hypothetical protein